MLMMPGCSRLVKITRFCYSVSLRDDGRVGRDGKTASDLPLERDRRLGHELAR